MFVDSMEDFYYKNFHEHSWDSYLKMLSSGMKSERAFRYIQDAMDSIYDDLKLQWIKENNPFV